MKKNNSGFTLIELVLSTAFFTAVLMFFVFGYLQVTRTFHKGTTIKRVTESGRIAIEDMARTIRLASSNDFTRVSGSGAERLCINGVRYGWNIGDILDQDTGLPLPTNETAKILDDFGSLTGVAPFSLVRSLDTTTCTGDFEIQDGFVLETTGDGTNVNSRGATSLLDEDVIVQALSLNKSDEGVEIDLTLSTSGLNNPAAGAPSENANCDANGFIVEGDHFCDVVRFRTFVSFRGS